MPQSALIQEDSEDLTDAEVQAAVPTRDVREFAEQLSHLSCGTCGLFPMSYRHAQRRRIPHLYNRTQVRCSAGHETTVLYRVDWLKERV